MKISLLQILQFNYLESSISHVLKNLSFSISSVPANQFSCCFQFPIWITQTVK